MKRYFFYGCLVLGVSLIILSLWPLVQYKIWEATEYQSQVLVSPRQENILGVNLLADPESGNFGQKSESNLYNEFYLTVPKLNLKKEKVLVNSSDFDLSLAHLTNTALPGERGNVFITGHSSIPLWQLTEKKAILYNLQSLKKGDQIEIEALGQKFSYRVEGAKVVSPQDTYVIAPPDNFGRFLTLMTCVPPGFNNQRLIVLSKLVSD